MFDFLHYTFGFQVSWQLMLVLDSCLSSLVFHSVELNFILIFTARYCGVFFDSVP